MAQKKRFSLHGPLRRIEGTLQKKANNWTAAVFGGKLVPKEIEETLKRTLEDNNVLTYDDYTESPNVFRVVVSTEDAAALRDDHPLLPGELAGTLRRFARNNGWVCQGNTVVVIAADPSMKTGQIDCHCVADPAPQDHSRYDTGGLTGFPQHMDEIAVDRPEEIPRFGEMGGTGATADARAVRPPQVMAPPPHATSAGRFEQPGATPMPDPAWATPGDVPLARDRTPHHPPTVTLLLQDGSSRSYLVAEGSNIIGRSQDADFRIPDTGVSRRHCSITWDGRYAILTDLGSKNGTAVNDLVVDNFQLADGDVITIGHSLIEVRITQPGARSTPPSPW